MRAIDEGGSSLLDNTIPVYTSYMADGGNSRQQLPGPAGRIAAAGTLNTAGTSRTTRIHPVRESVRRDSLASGRPQRREAPATAASSKKAAYDGRLPELV